MSDPADDSPLGVQHAGRLAIGALAGALAAGVVAQLPFDFSDEIERARSLGIVSTTVLASYPKSRDLLTGAAALGLPVLGALAVWGRWGWRRRAALAALLPPRDGPQRRKHWAWVLGVAVFVALTSFDASFFRQPGYNERVGGWVFLGEEGENLAWVQSLRDGGVYGRDFFCLYGPMLLYPLARLMDLTGESVAVARAYKYGLDLVAYAIVAGWLFTTQRRALGFVAACVGFVVLFPSRTYAGINGTHLRVALGLLPILLLVLRARPAQRGGAAARGLPLLAGAVAGQSLLFSQEVGLCSVIACSAMWFAEPQRGWRAIARDGAGFALGCAVSLLPMLALLVSQSAGGALFDSLYGYPRLVTLGYGALPFPSVSELVALEPRSVLPYAVIALYAFTAVRLATRAAIRGLGWRELADTGLLIFGVLLFRAALGRSDETNFYRVWPPAILLLMSLADEAVARLRAGAAGRRSAAALLVGTVAWLAGVVASTPYARVQLGVGLRSTWDFPGQWRQRAGGIALPRIERGGVLYDEATATAIRDIGFFLAKYARPEEPVYFFPNEAAYYFLFDRPNPTRYAIAYFAITTDQRRELVADLERKRPRLVVYSLDTWRVDDIPEAVQVPEVVAYLAAHYRTVARAGGVEFLVRQPGTPGGAGQ